MMFASSHVSQRVKAPLVVTRGVSPIALLLVVTCGCSKSAPEPKPSDAPYMASSAAAQANTTGTPIVPTPALERLANAAGSSPEGSPAASRGENPSDVAPLPGGASPDVRAPNVSAPDLGASPLEGVDQAASDGTRVATGVPAARPGDPTLGRTQLRPDLSPKELVEFLGVADRDMQGIWSRLPQIPGGREELIRLAKMKLEASRRLKNHDEADGKAKSTGARGELQALSHLASFSDLKSAQELEELAVQNLQSNDADLVSDSRLVLIGFAIESLQNGESGAADRIMGYIDQIVAADASEDVPTLMVMGQARDALAAYGYDEHAKKIRESIIKLYAESENPDLAMAAEELAGNVLFDDTDRLLPEILGDMTVGVDSWREAIEQLLHAAPDIRTVQYLASASLQFEAADKMAFVTTTFDAMTEAFDDQSSDAGREVRIAMAAMEARQSVVGARFNPVLPGVDGSELSMEPFAGRVVLVPFWAAAFPESLQLIGLLKQIQSSHPDEVAIVGVNLDGDDALLQEFRQINDLGFPSFRSKSSAEAEVANPIAAQFGIASMPFLAILDAQGNVAAVNFTGRGIEEKVEALLTQRAPAENP